MRSQNTASGAGGREFESPHSDQFWPDFGARVLANEAVSFHCFNSVVLVAA
jgi:hypothetical protein